MARILLVFIIFFIPQSYGVMLQMPAPGDDVVGNVITVYAEPGDTLSSIGRRHDVGYKEMRVANPNVSAYRIRPWTKITVPSAYVLPNVPREGIVINLAEMRLYYFPEDQNTVFTAPIGVGKEGWATPVMKSKIIEKIIDPAWHPPKSIREEALRKGKVLPDVVPAGPNNPLGEYALRLGSRSYLIHGTNSPRSIGKRSSHGCMRMLPEDIEQLFHLVPKNTTVRIIHAPVKVGWYQGEIFLESHEPFMDAPQSDLEKSIKKSIGNKPVNINWTQAWEVIQEQVGYPKYIGSQQ